MASEFGISSDDVITLLRQMDVPVRSHLTLLTDDQVARIRARWEREKRVRAEKQTAPPARRRRGTAAPAPTAAAPAAPASAEASGIRRRRRPAEVAGDTGIATEEHGFGRNREGDVEVLQALGARVGFHVEVVPPVSVGDGRPISSTSIRLAIAGGDLERAAHGLGRPYALGGRVVRGAARGRGLGFPTINLAPPSPRKLLPPHGVYAVRVQTPGGAHGGMLNLGARPTFGDASVGIEAHLFDTSGDWYDAWVRVDFIARLRDTQKFENAAALVEQLRRDEDNARRALSLRG